MYYYYLHPGQNLLHQAVCIWHKACTTIYYQLVIQNACFRPMLTMVIYRMYYACFRPRLTLVIKSVSCLFQTHADTATLILKNVYTPLLEIASYKKSQSKKLYSFRDNFESMVNTAEDNVYKVYLIHFFPTNNILMYNWPGKIQLGWKSINLLVHYVWLIRVDTSTY